MPPLDFSAADMTAIAPQLRKPEGEVGRKVGAFMAQHNNEVTAFTIDLLDLQPRDHVLEIGFGPGEGIAQAVQRTPQGFVMGVDYSPDMLSMAEERNHRSIMQEHVELHLGEARALPYEDESADNIFAVNVFHFWPDAMPELAECRRVLKPGGRVAFFMAYPSSWRPGLKESGVFIARDPEDVEKLLRDAGFTNVHSKTITMEDFKGFATVGEK